jgi:hypothetical protein
MYQKMVFLRRLSIQEKTMPVQTVRAATDTAMQEAMGNNATLGFAPGHDMLCLLR